MLTYGTDMGHNSANHLEVEVTALWSVQAGVEVTGRQVYSGNPQDQLLQQYCIWWNQGWCPTAARKQCRSVGLGTSSPHLLDQSGNLKGKAQTAISRGWAQKVQLHSDHN